MAFKLRDTPFDLTAGIRFMGKLTTHVLDTAKGTPAQGLKIDVVKGSEILKTLVTNVDGRIDTPILEASEFETGIYELRFHAGDYLRKSAITFVEPPFLDIIPIRFGVSDAAQHLHVPLLLSPFGYSTYRGS
jgi:5-hydroxyisourate hydrolase